MNKIPVDVLWCDNDDTLIQTVHTVIPGWQRAAAERGLPPKPESVWRDRWGGTPVELVQRVYQEEDISAEDAKLVLHARQNSIRRETEIIPAVPAGPAFVGDFEGSISVITSREYGHVPDTRYTARDGRPLFSLMAYVLDSSGYNLGDFDFIIGCDLVGSLNGDGPSEHKLPSKPDPRVFDVPSRLSEVRGHDPAFATYVGDDPRDYIAARDRGLNFIGVLTGPTDKQAFVNVGCSENVIVSSIADITDFLLYNFERIEDEYNDVVRRLQSAWSAETSVGEWSASNPAWGQCLVTAAAIQKKFGGQMLRGYVEYEGERIGHYWNRLPDGTIRDATWSKFGGKSRHPYPRNSSRTYILTSQRENVERYNRLVMRADLEELEE